MSKIIALYLLLIPTLAFCGDPFSVDDPATCAKGETNITIAYVHVDCDGEQSDLSPSICLSYGVTDALELGIGIEYLNETETKGFQDVLLGVRWRFLEETETAPQLLIGYELKPPTASVEHCLSNGETDHCAWLTIAKTLNDWYVFGDVGKNFYGDDFSNDNWYYGIGATYQLSPAWNVGAVMFGAESSEPDCDEDFCWEVGAAYAISSSQSAMASFGRSEKGYSDFYLYCGYSLSWCSKSD